MEAIPLSSVPNQDFYDIEHRIFSEKQGRFFLGGQEMPKDLRDVLRDEAESFKNSRLYHLLDEAATNEAVRMALRESSGWEHVMAGKQLYLWNNVMKNIVHKLSQR